MDLLVYICKFTPAHPIFLEGGILVDDISIIIESTQVILWVLLMDVDSPNLKPRPALENAAACLVYISHTINILTTLLATVALLQVFVLGGLMISLFA